MEPTEARAILLRQHDDLRRILADVRAADAGPAASRAVLEERLAALRVVFAEHNATEERLLEPILRLDYAWGPPRVQRMLEEHAAEHTVFRALMATPALAIAGRLADLVEEIEAHMAAEERTFLSSAVLRDEFVGHASG